MLASLRVIVPSYNGRHHLERCLTALREGVPEARVIVVDGSPSEASSEMVRSDFPEVDLLKWPNHGWAHANNRGLEHCARDPGARTFLFLNSDAFVSRASVVSMVSRLHSAPEVGVVGPVLLNEDGSRQANFGFWYWPTRMRVRRPMRVPVVSGACLATRRDVLAAAGLFDETFFLYNEELDWCGRVRELGYKVELLPEPVVHVGKGSTGQSPMLQLEEQRGFLYLSKKRSGGLATEVLRRAMQLEGWAGKQVARSSERRDMWERLESLARRAAFAESSFPVSGRALPQNPFLDDEYPRPQSSPRPSRPSARAAPRVAAEPARASF